MKCPTVSTFFGCVELRAANIGIGVFYLVAPLLLLANSCVVNYLNSEQFRMMITVLSIHLIIRGYWFYGIISKKTGPLVPQLVISLVKVIGLFCVPFVLAFNYDLQFPEPTRLCDHRFDNCDLRQRLAHKLSLISFVAYVTALLQSYLLIVEYSYYKYLNDSAELEDKVEDRSDDIYKSENPSIKSFNVI